ncbi:uncharacterized protein [Dysidea avara]|uniref:uncharacterized protein n=1 Tax=Dysidea avara TaxID=196820 RepID=UPI00332EDA29
MLAAIARSLGLTSLYRQFFPEIETNEGHAKETPKKRSRPMYSPPSSPPTAKKVRASSTTITMNSEVNSWPSNWQAERNVFQQKTTHNYGQARSIRPVGASGTYYNDSVITPSQQPMKSRTKASDVADCTGSWQPARGYLLSGGTPLLFFYDCESTGGNVHDDHIIEIAAEVVGPEEMFVTVKSFSELCFTSRIIGGIGCGVNKQMLVGTREFSYVFPDFLSWVNKCVIEVKKAYGKPFYPVLVAHNGFTFDYRILAAEVERRKLMAQFIKADLGFADTLFELKKMRKADDSILSEWSPEEQRRLSMDGLHRKCFPEDNCNRAHRALEDVQMMIKIFISSGHFNDIFKSLTIRSATQIITDWKNTLEAYLVQNEAQNLYGSHTSKAMAICLKQNRLSYEVLQEMFRRCQSQESFDNMIKDSGVKHKNWRQQLWEHFSQQ